MNAIQTKQRTLILVLFSLVHFLNHLYLLLIPAILPTIRSEFDLTYTLSGLVVTGLNLSYSLFALPAGYAADRLNRKMLITANIVWFTTGMFLTGFSTEYWQIFLLQVLAGIGGSLYHPSGLAMISDLFVEKRGRAMGIHGSLGLSSGFIGPLIAGVVGAALGWRWVFLLLTLPGFVISFLFWKLIPDEPGEKIDQPTRTTGTRAEGKISLGSAIAIISIVFAASSFGNNGITAFTTIFLVDEMSLDIVHAATLLSILSGMSIISQPISGWLSDYLGRKKVIAINLTLTTVCILALISVRDLFLATLLLVPLGYVSGSIGAVIFAYVADVTPSYTLGKVYGLFYAVGRGMGAFAPLFMGLIADIIGLKASFIILAGISLLGGLLILLVKEKNNR
ncbi:MAG: MFS transporter [Candidatus Bathyarchaeota archaeon]|nr:MAG: MFS transporter [Candidatus Bathyarchaeota archaeon]